MSLHLDRYKSWLTDNKNYSKKTISNTVSRMKRADKILPWFNDSIYQFKLEQEAEYKALSCSVCFCQ